ncbi:hypothetical protein [Clostridium sp. DJ247]|uniref:hypothetical protein n=1 Tax=Clostridium sp. DJ247 TaxID=2726188 RepID=UPI00162545AB|nr:hypothetical protein [Clostridium sp. DJ247]MBC2580609.1 hypothetical protein [Clostridium sp. DJ247]
MKHVVNSNTFIEKIINRHVAIFFIRHISIIPIKNEEVKIVSYSDGSIVVHVQETIY